MLKNFQIVQKYRKSVSSFIKSIMDLLPYRASSFLERTFLTHILIYKHTYTCNIYLLHSIFTPHKNLQKKYVISKQRTDLPREGQIASLLSHLETTGLDMLLSKIPWLSLEYSRYLHDFHYHSSIYFKRHLGTSINISLSRKSQTAE